MLPQSSLMNAAAGDSLPSGAMPDVVASEEHGAVSSHRGDGVDANATIMIVDDSRINVEIVEKWQQGIPEPLLDGLSTVVSKAQM